MSAEDLQSQIRQSTFGNLLEAIANAEEVVDRDEITLPRIAVVGDESAGKSSLLEAICKIPFPRGNETETRCPIKVRLIKENEEWSAKAYVGDSDQEEHTRNVSTRESITEVIRELQALAIEKTNQAIQMRSTTSARFSTYPVTVSIQAREHIRDFTFVDLPGCLSQVSMHAREDGGQDFGDVERIKNILLEYIEDEETILLVVIPATQRITTANILQLTSQVERDCRRKGTQLQFQQRTLFCLTKVDDVKRDAIGLLDPGKLLRGEDADFKAVPHGWYAVANNLSQQYQASENTSGSNMDFGSRLKLDREKESELFDGTYRDESVRKRCGVENLVGKLMEMLFEHISQKVPKMLDDCEELLRSTQSKLSELGPLVISDPMQEIEIIVSDIKRCYELAGKGDNALVTRKVSNSAAHLPEDALRKCKLGNIVQGHFRSFEAQIKRKGLLLESEEYKRKLLAKVEEARGGTMELATPAVHVMHEEVRNCIREWKDCTAMMCKDVAKAALDFLNILTKVAAHKYEHLPGSLYKYFEKMIGEQHAKAITRLGWLHVDAVTRPETLSKYLEQELNMLGNGPGLCRERDGHRDYFIHYLKGYMPVLQASYIDNATRAVQTHILDVPLGFETTRVESDALPEFPFVARKVVEGENVARLMTAKGDIEEKRRQLAARVDRLGYLRDCLQPHANNRDIDASIPTTSNPPESSVTTASNGSLNLADSDS